MMNLGRNKDELSIEKMCWRRPGEGLRSALKREAGIGDFCHVTGSV